jgi:hypothetical protein
MAHARLLGIASLLTLLALPAAGCSTETEPSDNLTSDVSSAPLSNVIASVPPGTPWNDVPQGVKARLESHAKKTFARADREWGARGMAEKIQVVATSATPAMTENYDRILKFILAADVPEGFKPSTDIANAQLRTELQRFYVVYCAERRHVLIGTNPEFKDWDGQPVKDFLVRDAATADAQKALAAEVIKKLRAIPAASLSDVERAIVRKTVLVGRQLEEGSTGFNLGGNDTRQTGTAPSFLFDVVTQFAMGDKGVFTNAEAVLETVNAHALQSFLHMNKGTIDTFAWDFESYVDPTWLSGSGMDPKSDVAKQYLALAGWWKDRMVASPDAAKSCTLYTPAERAHLWNAITADNLANEDGTSTLESYAGSYKNVAAGRLADIKTVAVKALESVFATRTDLVDDSQLAQVKGIVEKETRPAAMVTAMVTALDQVTGKSDASAALTKQMESLTMIGGYKEGETLREADKATVLQMWEQVRGYVKTRYAGRPVDISALMPAAPIVTTGDGAFAGSDGNVTVGLANAYKKSTLFAVLLHEAKHAIDYNSHASVQGAAWEGAAVVAEDMVAAPMIAQLMASDPNLPLYRLGTAVDDVRLTATTDATLKVLLRTSCGAGEPDTIALAKEVVQGYGYTDPDVLTLRSRRAHMGTQYLSYDLGYVLYNDLLKWLGAQVPNAPVTIDPMLLQACGMPSPNQDAAAVAKLKGCLGL